MAKRTCLLIGNGKFSKGLENLRGPANDVRHLTAVLGSNELGRFKVLPAVDKPSDELRRLLEVTFNSATQDDMLVVYYSGHGKLDQRGNLQLATSDTDLEVLRSTSIGLPFVKTLASDSPAQQILLMLDCCYSGRAGEAFANRTGVEDQLANTVGAGIHLLTSASSTETALEKEDEKSGEVLGLFTRRVVEGIESGAADRDGDGKVTLSDLRDYLKRRVRGQSPQYWGIGAAGELVVSRNPNVQPAALSASIRDAIASEIPEVRRSVIARLAKLADGNHSGRAIAAREALEELAEDDSSSVAERARDAVGREHSLAEPESPAADSTPDEPAPALAQQEEAHLPGATPSDPDAPDDPVPRSDGDEEENDSGAGFWRTRGKVVGAVVGGIAAVLTIVTGGPALKAMILGDQSSIIVLGPDLDRDAPGNLWLPVKEGIDLELADLETKLANRGLDVVFEYHEAGAAAVVEKAELYVSDWTVAAVIGPAHTGAAGPALEVFERGPRGVLSWLLGVGDLPVILPIATGAELLAGNESAGIDHIWRLPPTNDLQAAAIFKFVEDHSEGLATGSNRSPRDLEVTVIWDSVLPVGDVAYAQPIGEQIQDLFNNCLECPKVTFASGMSGDFIETKMKADYVIFAGDAGSAQQVVNELGAEKWDPRPVLILADASVNELLPTWINESGGTREAFLAFPTEEQASFQVYGQYAMELIKEVLETTTGELRRHDLLEHLTLSADRHPELEFDDDGNNTELEFHLWKVVEFPEVGPDGTEKHRWEWRHAAEWCPQHGS